MTKNKTQRGRDRRGETLFIDAKNMGKMVSAADRVLTDGDISKIASTVHSWRNEDNYKDVPGFCFNAEFDDIEKNNFLLTPGRYVGVVDEENDGELFDQKMRRLTGVLKEQQEQGVKLDQQIAENLKRIDYGI